MNIFLASMDIMARFKEKKNIQKGVSVAGTQYAPPHHQQGTSFSSVKAIGLLLSLFYLSYLVDVSAYRNANPITENEITT